MTLVIEQIKARAEAATPGPWERHYDGIIRRVDGLDNWICQEPSGDIRQITADMEFIAHARTDIPFLIQEIERLQAELLSLRVMVDRLAEARAILLASRPEVPLSSIEGFIEGRSDWPGE